MSSDSAQWPQSDARLRPGIALFRARQFYSAIQYLRRCIAEGAGGAAWFHLGAAQHALGQLKEAATSFTQAAHYGFQKTEARCARATVMAELGESRQAEQELEDVLEEQPAHARALANLAILLERRGAQAEALALYDRSIDADPASSAARLNRGAMRLARGEVESALADFDALLGHRESAEAQVSRARALFALHRDEEAMQAADRALALEPRNARAWLDKLLALSSLGKVDEARSFLERAFLEVGDALLGLPNGPRRREELDPEVLYIDRGLQRQDVCAWNDRGNIVGAIRVLFEAGNVDRLADPGMLFRMLALPFTPTELKQAGAAAARRVQLHTSVARAAIKTSAPRERMRIGFLSPEFRSHPAARLLRRLFSDRDRRRLEFFGYALNAEDGSSIRHELASSADTFIDASAWATEDIVRRIRADELDILVDNSGYFAATRPEILAARVAPVQAGWMGIACTLGPGLLDYRITDALTSPLESQDDWYERLVLLPAPHAAYDTNQAIGERGPRATHGLPQEAFVFACFNQAFKICPEIFKVWMRLLRRVPGSVLWLLDNGRTARENLARHAQDAGLAAERLVFAPRVELAEHLGRMHHADLFLDTLHYGAHTTAADALHAGVPVLTCPGETMASRLAATFVRCAGIGDMVVKTLEAYEHKAIQLAANPAALSEVRERLTQAQGNAPLFATAERVRALERAFIAMVERSRAGLPPDTLIIE